MSSEEKKAWKKPELRKFANEEEAIEYYSKHGTPEHVEAVKRMADHARELQNERNARRVASRR